MENGSDNKADSVREPRRYPLPPAKTLLHRGWHKKCPQCGEGNLYLRWMKLQPHCPVCGLRYLPDQGDLLGPLVLLDRVVFLIPFIVLFYFRLWHPGLWTFLVVGGVMTFLMVYTMPNRNGVSLAFDYYLRRRSGDLADEEEEESPKPKV